MTESFAELFEASQANLAKLKPAPSSAVPLLKSAATSW